MKRFVMDYDNTPGVGPKFLFYVNDDGSMKLAILEDVEREIQSSNALLARKVEILQRGLGGSREALGKIIGQPFVSDGAVEEFVLVEINKIDSAIAEAARRDEKGEVK